MTNSLLLMIFLFVFCQIAVQADESVSERDRDEAMEVIADYTANRSKLNSYAFAAMVNFTRVYKNSPEKNSSQIDWHLGVVDQKKAKRRFDSIRRRAYESKLTGEFKSTDGLQSLFVEGSKMLQKHGSSIVEELDMDELSPEEQRKKVIMGGMVFIDPFNLPFSNGSDLNASARYPKTRLYETKLNRDAVEIFRKDIRFTEIHFVKNERYRLKMAVRFANFGEERLPVETVVYRHEPDGQKHEVSSLATRWGKLGNDFWVPVFVSVSDVQGNPSKPSVFADAEIKFHWLDSRGFPASILDPASDYNPVELRDRIVDYAAKIDPAKAAIK